jgi:hypothetical protein
MANALRPWLALALPLVFASVPAAAQNAPGGDASMLKAEGSSPCSAGRETPNQDSGTQQTLSDKLSDCNGVLRPSVGIDRGIHVEAPDPHGGTMPVIRPDRNEPTPK